MASAITMECFDAAGTIARLHAILRYNPVDPFAVTVTFPTAARDVVWTFARDLLSGGLTAPTGEGDVRTWPSLDAGGCTTVVLALSSPDGELVAQAARQDVRRFIRSSLAAVPAGMESDHIDIDQLITDLFQSEHN